MKHKILTIIGVLIIIGIASSIGRDNNDSSTDSNKNTTIESAIALLMGENSTCPE